VRPKVLGGQVFSAFSKREREQIWARLEIFDGLIPSLFTFFRDITYLQLCVDCVKRLVYVPRGINSTVPSYLRRRITYVRGGECRVVIQVAEDRFISRPGSLEERADLGIRQLYACAMRDYPDMPREPEPGNRVKKSAVRANRAVLRRLADLAARLGFVSEEIKTLRRYPVSRAARATPDQSRPYRVTPGPGLPLKERCGPPLAEAYEEDRDFLFIHDLHDERAAQGEGITSFFAPQSTYFAFFGRPSAGRDGNSKLNVSPPLGSTTRAQEVPSQGSDGDDAGRSRRYTTTSPRGSPEPMIEYIDNALAIFMRQEADQSQGSPARGLDNIVAAYAQQEPHPSHGGHELVGQDLDIALRDEADRPQESLEGVEEVPEHVEEQAEQLEDGDVMQEGHDEEDSDDGECELGWDRIAREQQEKEERERQERAREEREKKRGALIREMEELDREQPGQLERLEREKQQRKREERDRQEQTRDERENLLRQRQEREDQERLDRERQAEEHARAVEPLQELQVTTRDRADSGGTILALEELLPSWAASKQDLEDLDQEEDHGPEGLHSTSTPGMHAPVDDVGSQGADQQQPNEPVHTKDPRLALAPTHEPAVAPTPQLLDDVLPEDPPTVTAPGPSHQLAVAPVPQQSRDDRVRINMKIRKRGFWKDLPHLMVDPSNPSDAEGIMRDYIRKRIRPFNTSLRMIGGKDCFKSVIGDGTNTILLIPDGELDINGETLDAASKFRADALAQAEPGRKRTASDNISRFYHPRKIRRWVLGPQVPGYSEGHREVTMTGMGDDPMTGVRDEDEI
jgi:hypothetical protein